ncbi:trypsin-like serine protease [Actinoplanes sp. N902-109]|uniref:S1 family peptidase n=1 Tax=Actinoplanes sp. (strain N902-109) TaxID=649831 RepID=UPI00032951D0|nr:trypsin-like serine protease [Actinoplanes sp. N902-109]AGL15629.1 secreted esterase [Actinoplanes sp. N902-109]
MAASVTTAVTVGAVALGMGTANAIANGEPVPDGQYRFSVKLTMTGIPVLGGGTRNSACSGALIASRWIVTAGHCFRDENGVRVERLVAASTTATVGRTDLTTGTGGTVAQVIAVRQSATADVAVAQLDTAVRRIKPLRVSSRAPKVDDVLRITGYGSLTSTNPVPATHLQTGQMTVVSLQDSTLGLKGFAPQPDTTPCPYDSGAPFFRESRWRSPELVAVVSNGPSCPHTAIESPARTDNLADWIHDIIR